MDEKGGAAVTPMELEAECDLIDRVVEQVTIGSFWKYKDGERAYCVMALAVHDDTEELMVVYKPFSSDPHCSVSPARTWFDKFERPQT